MRTREGERPPDKSAVNGRRARFIQSVPELRAEKRRFRVAITNGIIIEIRWRRRANTLARQEPEFVEPAIKSLTYRDRDLRLKPVPSSVMEHAALLPQNGPQWIRLHMNYALGITRVVRSSRWSCKKQCRSSSPVAHACFASLARLWWWGWGEKGPYMYNLGWEIRSFATSRLYFILWNIASNSLLIANEIVAPICSE